MGQEIEEDIWGQILQESTRKNIDLVESRSVIVLGDRNSGKSTLLARTHNEDINDINKGVALTYTFLDVYEDDNDDPVGRMDFWQVEGDTAHSDLLRETALRSESEIFLINNNNTNNNNATTTTNNNNPLSLSSSAAIPNSNLVTSSPGVLAVIVLDFSRPWTLAETLKKWLKVLQEHLKAVGVGQDVKAAQDQLRVYAQTYKEPAADAATNKKKKKKGGSLPEDSSFLPPLDDAVLTNNLGIPIVVVCGKCDMMPQLESDFNYNEGTFEYILQHLRRICLSYGASLIYTSARKETNCNILVDYIEHRLFGFELRQKAQLLEKESTFIPFGWDSMAKIKLDFDNQKVCKDPEEPYENIVTKPHNLKRKENQTLVVITAEDDQTFLGKHKTTLENENDKDKNKDNKGRGLMATIKGGGAISALSSTSLSPSLPSRDFEEEESNNSSPNNRPSTTPRETPVSAAAAMPAHTTPPPTAPAAGGADAKDANKDVLRGFFNSLLKADSRAKTTALRNDVKAMLQGPTKK